MPNRQGAHVDGMQLAAAPRLHGVSACVDASQWCNGFLFVSPKPSPACQPRAAMLPPHSYALRFSFSTDRGHVPRSHACYPAARSTGRLHMRVRCRPRPPTPRLCWQTRRSCRGGCTGRCGAASRRPTRARPSGGARRALQPGTCSRAAQLAAGTACRWLCTRAVFRTLHAHKEPEPRAPSPRCRFQRFFYYTRTEEGKQYAGEPWPPWACCSAEQRTYALRTRCRMRGSALDGYSR